MPQEPVHERGDAEGEAELHVLLEVGAQVLAVEAVRRLEIVAGGDGHRLLLGLFWQQLAHALCGGKRLEYKDYRIERGLIKIPYN